MAPWGTQKKYDSLFPKGPSNLVQEIRYTRYEEVQFYCIVKSSQQSYKIILFIIILIVRLEIKARKA